jgi:diguanylate cyclase (GGDEF)-like protein
MLAPLRTAVGSALAGGSEETHDSDTRWIGALVLLLGAVLTSVLLAIVPPTAEGTWGWMVAAVVIAIRIGAAAGLISGHGPVRDGVVYAISLSAIAGLCALQYLASREAYFHDLILIDLLFVAAVHTVRRTLAAVALAVAGLVPPLVDNSIGAVSWAEWAAEAVLWTLVAGLVLLYTRRSRGQHAQLRRTRERAEELARVDVLTGLGNRRAFDEALDRELGHARRYGTRLSVLIGDLDGFKAVNDRHGHAAGDEVLRQAATLLAETVRRPDACFRWGGDEFAVVLRNTSRPAAELVATRVRAVVARGVCDPDAEPVTLSVGVAELGEDQDPSDLLATADADLLEAKTRRPVGARRRMPRFGRLDEARDPTSRR